MNNIEEHKLFFGQEPFKKGNIGRWSHGIFKIASRSITIGSHLFFLFSLKNCVFKHISRGHWHFPWHCRYYTLSIPRNRYLCSDTGLHKAHYEGTRNSIYIIPRVFDSLYLENGLRETFCHLCGKWPHQFFQKGDICIYICLGHSPGFTLLHIWFDFF